MTQSQMTMEQLHEYVRAQEKDNMKSAYQASFNNAEKQKRKYRPQTAVAKDKLRESAHRLNAAQQDHYTPSKQRNSAMAGTYHQVRQADERSQRSVANSNVCPKHGTAVLNTVQHRSGKADYLSPQPSSRPGSAYRGGVDNVRGMQTNKFLHTDLKQYLEKDEHVTCISCQHCVKIKDKVLQYKYNRGIQSSYGANFQKSSQHQKQTIFNLDAERRQLKVPFKPSANYVTTNGAALINSKGTGMIGAMTSDGKGYHRRGAPKGETDDDVKRSFVNNSSYQLTFPIYGAIPEANKRPGKPFVAGYGKVDHTSSYTQNFAGTPDEKYRETAKLEKQRVKAYQKQQNRGNLNPSVALPFKGQSTAQKEFSKRNANGVEKILPFDMLVVPHGMSMPTRSEAQSKFNEKPMRKLH